MTFRQAPVRLPQRPQAASTLVKRTPRPVVTRDEIARLFAVELYETSAV